VTYTLTRDKSETIHRPRRPHFLERGQKLLKPPYRLRVHGNNACLDAEVMVWEFFHSIFYALALRPPGTHDTTHNQIFVDFLPFFCLRAVKRFQHGARALRCIKNKELTENIATAAQSNFIVRSLVQDLGFLLCVISHYLCLFTKSGSTKVCDEISMRIDKVPYTMHRS
jgi:hypothetical protein